MYEKLEAKVNQLKEEFEDYSFRLQKYEKLCQRVHQMVMNSKDLVFVDSSSNMEELNLGVFFHRTHVIMTDNCDELREALVPIWPNCIVLLCIFHILQQGLEVGARKEQCNCCGSKTTS